MDEAIRMNQIISRPVRDELKEIAIEYHARTEVDPGCATAELQFAYLKASKYGVAGVEVRKAIARYATHKATIKRRAEKIQKVYDEAIKRGDFLHETRKQVSNSELWRGFYTAVVSGAKWISRASWSAATETLKRLRSYK